MKMKKVVYNGGTEKYMNQICNEPTDLVKGAVYTVSREVYGISRRAAEAG